MTGDHRTEEDGRGLEQLFEPLAAENPSEAWVRTTEEALVLHARRAGGGPPGKGAHGRNRSQYWAVAVVMAAVLLLSFLGLRPGADPERPGGSATADIDGAESPGANTGAPAAPFVGLPAAGTTRTVVGAAGRSGSSPATTGPVSTGIVPPANPGLTSAQIDAGGYLPGFGALPAENGYVYYQKGVSS
jgi:hypothetical protein